MKMKGGSILLLLSSVLLSGCSFLGNTLGEHKIVEYEIIKPETFPVLKAVGYAPIETQPGTSHAEKMINAIRASKLDAYRELAEQTYGQQIDSNMTFGDMVLKDSRAEAKVSGLIRGARVVKSYPVGEAIYATELELDFERVYNLYLSTSMPRRVKDVNYY